MVLADDDTTPAPNMARVLLCSFLAVSAGAAIAILLSLAAQILIMKLGYPALAERWFDAFALPPDEFSKTVREAPESFRLPDSFYAIAFGSNLLLAALAGYVAARLAPAGRFGHGVIVAVLLLLNEFQDESVQRELMPDWFRGVGAVAFPIAVLIGAGICDRMLLRKEESADTHEP